MNRSYHLHFIIFIGSIAMLLSVCSQSFAASFSGRVVDEEGNPVAGVTIGLPSVSTTTPQNRREPVLVPSQQDETNETGEFSIRNITSPIVQLALLPLRASAYEIRKAEIEWVPFYIDENRGFFSGLTFSIPPGADIKDVEITIRSRMRIRGRVLAADGTALSNAQVNLSIERRNIDGKGRGSRGGSKFLDADGSFVEYVREPAHYIVSVRYEGRSAESEEILLKDGEQHDKLVLKLDDAPRAKPARAMPPIANRRQMEADRAGWQRERQGMWAINPENRHAYKKVHCETREAAHAHAVEQGAYLVAINDAAEQEWLIEVFGEENFWIGLTDISEAETPHWDNGEPVTYTNWNSPEETDENTEANREPGADPNYTVLIGLTGKWQAARQQSSIARLTEWALLEKTHFTFGAPASDPDVEID